MNGDMTGRALVVVVDYAPLGPLLVADLEASPIVSSATAIRSGDDVVAAIDAVGAALVVADEQIDPDVWELCSLVKAQRPGAGWLVVGNGLDADGQRQADAAGADGYLAKDLTGETIRVVVEDLLRGRARRRPPPSSSTKNAS